MADLQISRVATRNLSAVVTTDGIGANISRAIGTPALANLTPFLILDRFCVPKGAGFPDHAHRGMMTLTYMIEGSFQHEDFLGNKGVIHVGDAQLMCAGKGIVHSEMPLYESFNSEMPTGVQLWIDLPVTQKLSDPYYIDLKAADIPTAHPQELVEIKILAGSVVENNKTITGPITSIEDFIYLDITLEEDSISSVYNQPIPPDLNAFIFVIEGAIGLNSATQIVTRNSIAVLSRESTQVGVEITCLASRTRFLLVAGKPLPQEIHQAGPFVMTTKQGLVDAFMDYRGAKNGFENAARWKSSIHPQAA